MSTKSTPEFRAAMADLGRGAAAATVIGLFLNVLHLSLPLYTIQIYDRVISSGNLDTLVALTLLVSVLLGFQAVLDVLRARLFNILGARAAAPGLRNNHGARRTARRARQGALNCCTKHWDNLQAAPA